MTPSKLPASSSATYLDVPEAAERFLTGLVGARTLAVDTEGASYHRFVDRIYLLQLSTADEHAIIDPLRVTGLATLGRLLEDPAVEVVFHDADYDLRLLHQDYGWRVTNIFDTRVAAQLLGIKAFGLAALLDEYFGVKLDKKHQRADWSMRPLSADMLDYAAQDTRHLLGLSQRLRQALESKRRWHWAQEEFQRLEGTRWEPEDASTAWMRVKGARDLTRRELARLRELVPWRDEVARGLDRSTFRVISNEVLLEVARRDPTRPAELAAIKGMNPRLADARGREVIDALARANAVPEGELPRFPRAPRWDKDPEFDDKVGRLRQVRDAAAHRLELDPGVLCSRERMEAVVRRAPVHVRDLEELPELRRWQLEVLGEEFVRVLRGGSSPYRDA
ncbi:MAG: ribonuclease D [Gemmatimonadetes bacterium]|nr:ribonuclease D [Gemmatimonadota bacterium]